MSHFIVFAGKGGTGKSTLAALTVRYLREKNLMPVLAVDADPNFCLPELLEISSFETLAEIRDTALQRKPDGMSLDEWLELEINRIVEESEGFDLLVMGRPEGSGCYCAVNNVLKRILQDISEKYKYIVVDNEAGMEHISRGILNKINFLFIIGTPAKSSIQAALRINELIKELNIVPKKKIFIINQIMNRIEEQEEFHKEFKKIVYLNFDENIKELSEKGKSIFSLQDDSSIIKNFYSLLEEEID
ncbi:MAG: AAA family ATPase [Thermodesulfovibrio sp.]|nr:AAA family ATPase [Thermodesulfovibrio sp.]